MSQQQQQQPQTEAERIRDRKRKVIDTINEKFGQEIWRERLLKICGGDESRIMKALNSFITYIMNDDGGKDDRKAYIADCTIASISTAFLEAFQMGIEVGGGRDHAYLVNYAGQCELDISYKGFVYALNKHFDNAFVDARCVFEGDKFTCEISDTNATYKHTPVNPFDQSWEKLSGCYCYFSYTLRDGGGKVSRLIMIPRGKDAQTPDSLAMIRSKAKGSWAWKDFPFEQCKKATIRRASKIPFASIDFGDEDVNPEQVDNRHYQLEGSSSDKLRLMMDKHREMLEDEKPPADAAKKDGEAAPQPAPAPAANKPAGDTPAAQPSPAPAQPSPMVASAPSEGDNPDDAPRYEDIDQADFGESGGVIIEGTAQTVPESRVEHTATAEHVMDVAQAAAKDAWDGKTLSIGGKKQVNDFPTAAAGAIYLKKVIGNRKHKQSRLDIIRENPLLIAALIKENQQRLIDELHKLAGEGA